MSRENPYRAAGTFTGSTYVARAADRGLLQEIADNGRYPYACAPRQSGKSSWITRTRQSLDPIAFRTAMVDLSTLPVEDLTTLLRAVLEKIAEDAQLDASAVNPDSPARTFEAWLGAHPTQRLVVFVDEMDRLLDAAAPVRERFLAIVRSLFNDRVKGTGLDRLQFVLTGAAHPLRLIQNQLVSPFNVGAEIQLAALNREQVEELASRLGDVGVPVDPLVAQRIHEVSGGLVYLCQLILESLWKHAKAHGGAVTPAVVDAIVDGIVEGSPSDIHFTNIQQLVLKAPDVRASFNKLWRGEKLSQTALFDLLMTGVASPEAALRCKIYERVFGPKGQLDLTEIEPPGRPYQRHWYVHRDEEAEALARLRAGEPILVSGPRGIGKSTFLRHLLEDALGGPKAWVELRESGGADARGEPILSRFADAIAVGAGLPQDKRPRDGRQHWTARLNDWMEDHALPAAKSGLTLAVEDVDALGDPTLVRDVMAMLGRWSERAGREPWSRLRIVTTASTTSARLGTSWIPHRIELGDLDVGQALKLAGLYDLRWTQGDIQQALMENVGGHPLLLRIAMYDARMKRGVLATVTGEARDASGVYERHLAGFFRRIEGDFDLREALKRILRSSVAKVDDRALDELASAGVVHATKEGLQIRYPIYKTYLKKRWSPA